MSDLFLKIINMSISASWLVLAVLLLRFVLKKAPKWINVLLWGIVAMRLVFPFSIESALSLIPSAETISPGIMMENTPSVQTGVPAINNVINPVIGSSLAPATGASANPLQIWIPILSIIWVVGVAALLLYTVVSYWRLRRKVSEAVILRDNIFQSENVASPFVLGIVKPKVYLPYHMDSQDLSHVVAHEQAHIRRRDHWWKPLGFLLLTIHWFNPLMWLAYVLLCRDIELACDEKVIKELGNEQRADYSQALVSCSIHRRMIAACPLAFGEVGVKERVKSVMNYKKPAFWVVVLAVTTCVVVAVCFLTNPMELTIYDVYGQDGYSVINQEEVDITLYVDKNKLPEAIYTEEGYEFKPGEVLAYSTETSRIYLHKAMLSNESDDLLYLIFDCSYDLSDSGSFVSPYKFTDENDGMQSNLNLQSRDLRDGSTVYSDALDIRGFGPGTQFAFYISKEACLAAKDTLIIDVVCNRIEYAKAGHGYDSQQGSSVSTPDKITFEAEVLEVYDGYFLVRPEPNWAINSADQIEVPVKNMDPALEPQVGDIIEIVCSGEILETYPARLSMVYSIKVVTEALTVTKWFDYLDNPSGMEDELTTDLPDYPGVTFRFTKNQIIASKPFDNSDLTGKVILIDGMPIWNAFFTDVTGDGYPEICATYTYGSGIIDSRVVVYDYANGASYELSDRGNHDFMLRGNEVDGQLLVEKRAYPNGELVASGPLVFQNDCIQIDYVEETSLESAISAAILDHYHRDDPDGLIHVESHVLLANETMSGTPKLGAVNHMEKTTVYLLVFHEKYSTYGGELEAVGGSYVPTALTFSISDSGEYVLEEYWEPRDGGYYVDDIRNKFPGTSADDALNGQAYIEDLEAQNYSKALAYMNSAGSLDTKIAELLDEICASPGTFASEPEKYLEAHESEYQELLGYGEFTLRYCFDQFLMWNQTDLREYIMARACEDISLSWGEAILIDSPAPTTGQAWFDAFCSNAESLAGQLSAEELEKHYPATWLFLQLIGKSSVTIDAQN